MNEVKLNRDQIYQIKEYLQSLGYNNTYEMMELLDHFSCKVEDILSAEPDISFRLAVNKARLSFGFMGLNEIVKAFRKHTIKTNRKVYWKEVFRIITSVKYLPLLILLGVAGYKGWIWSEVHQFIIKGWNIYIVLIAIIYVIVANRVSRSVNSAYRKTYNYLLGLNQQDFYRLFFVALVSWHHKNFNISWEAVFPTFIIVYSAVHIPARYKMMKAAIKYDSELKSMVNDDYIQIA